jgi:hypothetical protein
LKSLGRTEKSRYFKTNAKLLGEWLWRKRESWSYQGPGDIKTEDVASISFWHLGDLYPRNGGGLRDAVTISLIKNGERLHTIYLRDGAEYTKERFLGVLDENGIGLKISTLMPNYPGNSFWSSLDLEMPN